MTKQRKTIFDFLRNNLHRQFTVKQMQSSLASEFISLSTLYRNLKILEKDGYIKCSLKNTNLGNEVLYQYISKENCSSHIHAICTICENTFHLEHSEESLINNSLLNSHGFFVDNNKTVIYGVCKDCH